MNNLEKNLLSSIEQHGKSYITGIYSLYPHHSKMQVLRGLINLKWGGGL